MAAAGLTEVQVVTEHSPNEATVRDINADTTTMRRIDELVTESDMVILIGSALPQVPVGFAITMAEAARQSGNLLAGVLVDQQDWDSPQGAEAMAVLRMELDMLVSITQVSLATAFVDVFKGISHRGCVRACSLDPKYLKMTQETNNLLVRQQRLESKGVLSLTPERPDGAALGEWEPGAHIDIVKTSGTVRQYSLCGDPTDKTAYRIAALKEDEGRGGSKEIHDSVRVGDLLAVRGPRNHFALEPATHYLLIGRAGSQTTACPYRSTARTACARHGG